MSVYVSLSSVFVFCAISSCLVDLHNVRLSLLVPLLCLQPSLSLWYHSPLSLTVFVSVCG